MATHEDIENVLTEVGLVTTKTEEIKAQISGDLWNRQTRWNQKRDVYGELLGLVSEMQAEYVKLHQMHVRLSREVRQTVKTLLTVR